MRVLGSSRTMSRILVIDDNLDSATMLAELLARRGHAVDVAHDGLVAYDMVLALHPEIAVIDIGLPTIDGYELARRLRTALGAAAPRMIALTGYGAEDDRALSREAGFESHLTKPVQLGKLLALLDPSSAP